MSTLKSSKPDRRFVQFPVDDLIVGKNWSRGFGPGDVKELADSMTVRQISPIIIRSKGDVVVGFRRVSAARLLEWDTILAEIDDVTSAAILNLMENLHRNDPTLWEEIQGIRDVFGPDAPVTTIAEAVKKSRTWVTPRVKIWGLSEQAITNVRLGKSGITEINTALAEYRGLSATSRNLGYPSQTDVKRMVTHLVTEGRTVEAYALSYALGGVTKKELRDGRST